LESAGKTEEIKRIDEQITIYQNELNNLENKDTITTNNITNTEEELKHLKENLKENNSSSSLKDIESVETKLNDLETDHAKLKTMISEKNETITNLTHEKEDIIKKCLMKLHADMKKNYRQVAEDHDKYVELYTKAREEQHSIERKMRNLKVLVYKNYKIRLK
jgi:hypothetical protein